MPISSISFAFWSICYKSSSSPTVYLLFPCTDAAAFLAYLPYYSAIARLDFMI